MKLRYCFYRYFTLHEFRSSGAFKKSAAPEKRKLCGFFMGDLLKSPIGATQL
jgi:hypothetical protein